MSCTEGARNTRAQCLTQGNAAGGRGEEAPASTMKHPPKGGNQSHLPEEGERRRMRRKEREGGEEGEKKKRSKRRQPRRRKGGGREKRGRGRGGAEETRTSLRASLGLDRQSRSGRDTANWRRTSRITPEDSPHIGLLQEHPQSLPVSLKHFSNIPASGTSDEAGQRLKDA